MLNKLKSQFKPPSCLTYPMVYSEKVRAYIDPATDDANHSIHPARKLVPLPKPMRAKLYAPPARGIADDSSAKLIAVSIASKPLSAKVRTTPPGPASPMEIPMPRKTPAPIIMPRPIIVTWNSESSRASSGVGWCEGPGSGAIVFVLKCLARGAATIRCDALNGPF